ncbi:hypothetical protein F030043B2_28860 [Bacteroides fragilis]
MYSFKEKQKHYTELRNPDAAEQDLELLRKKQPELSTVSMFSRNPKRYADDILYALLDVAERDEIRNNRRTVEIAPVQDTEKNISKSTNSPKVEKKKANRTPKSKVEKPKKEPKPDTEKSKSTKSIPPSTGTISPIQESKPQPSSTTTES